MLFFIVYEKTPKSARSQRVAGFTNVSQMSWVKAFSLSKLGRSAKVHVIGDTEGEGGDGKEPDASDEGQLIAMHFASKWRNKHKAAKKSDTYNTTTHAVKPSEASQSTSIVTEKPTPASTPPVVNSSSSGRAHIETEPSKSEEKQHINTIIRSKSASSVSTLNLIDLEHSQRASDTHALDIHSHRSYDGPLAIESRKNGDQHSDSPPFSPSGMNTLSPGAAERRRVSFFHRTDIKDPSTAEETKSAPTSGGLDYLDFSNRNLIQQVDESSDTDSNKSEPTNNNSNNKNHTAYQITPATPTSEASPKVTRKTSVMDNIKLMTSKLVSSVITPRPQTPPMTARQHLDALINPSNMPKAAGGGDDEESYRSPFSEWKHRQVQVLPHI